MKDLLIFVTILAAVVCRSIPNTDYVPTNEQLTLVFDDFTSNLTKCTGAEAEPPATVPNESVFTDKKLTLTNNFLEEKTNNTISQSVTPTTVVVDISNKVNKEGASVNNTNKPVNNNNINFVDDGTQHEKQTPGNGNPEVYTRLDDDRVSLGVDDCALGMVRLGDTCVVPDRT